MSATHTLLLRGCTPVPLAHYLKALGVLRLVAEQADADALGHWSDDGFVLTGRLDRAALLDFFLHDYRPTPVIAPWNGGSGFYPKDNTTGIAAIEAAGAARLQPYADTIRLTRAQLAAAGVGAESPKEDAKAALLARLRATLPDAALRWLDAAVVLGDGSLRYPPLLGTGGNDGRLDFTNNLMQRLAELIDPASGTPSPLARQHLPAALFAEAAPGLLDKAIGQFAPGAAGGPNAGNGYGGPSQVNAWDFVLMLEGALLFGAAVTRRLESGDPAALAFPFAVRPRLAGVATGGQPDEAAARGELWLPLWQRPCSSPELATLFAEGRVTLGKRLRGGTSARAARDGLDFVRALASYGADRGIGAFERYAFAMRAGKAFLATPLGRFEVLRRPAADLIADLDRNGFLDRLRSHARGDTASAAVRSAARRLDDALFALATTAQSPTVVQRVLIALGEVQQVLGSSSKAREVGMPPVPQLRFEWIARAHDRSDEFRMALALLGSDLLTQRWLDSASAPKSSEAAPDRPSACTRWPWGMQLAPVDGRGSSWQTDSRDHLAADRLESLIAESLYRRLLPPRPNDERYALLSLPPVLPGVKAATITAFLQGGVDDARVLALLRGLALVQLAQRQPRRLVAKTDYRPGLLPAALVALMLIFTPKARMLRLGLLRDPATVWPAPREAAARLAAGDTHGAVAIAWRRLRSAGLPLPEHPHRPPALPGLHGPRLVAALAVPLHDAELRALALRLMKRPRHPAESTEA